MWNRKEVKKKGKQAFENNYWKCVLVALIFIFATGGSSGVSVPYRGSSSLGKLLYSQESSEEGSYLEEDDLNNYENYFDYDGSDSDTDIGSGVAILFIVFIVIVIALIVIAISFSLKAFLLNPLSIGCHKFFLKNLSEVSPLSYLSAGFDKNYKNMAKTMFLRDLYTFLWSLLLIIPGIVKSYEYRMIPYLLAENPDMTTEEAFEESRSMMDGQKWSTFILDLSFIGWEILSLCCCCGILSVFYVNPYKNSANAALYEELRYRGNKTSEDNFVISTMDY